MTTLADVTEIKMPTTGDVKIETGETAMIAMMNEEGKIEMMSVVKIEMRTHAERGERDQLTTTETMLRTDANNALKIMLKSGELSARTSTSSK